jgi:hypothetical protein
MVARGRCGDPVLSRSRLVVECRLRRLLETGRPVYRRPVSHSGPLRGHLARLTQGRPRHRHRDQGRRANQFRRSQASKPAVVPVLLPEPLASESMSCYDRTRRSRPSGSYGSVRVSVSLRSATPSRTLESPRRSDGSDVPSSGPFRIRRDSTRVRSRMVDPGEAGAGRWRIVPANRRTRPPGARGPGR